MPNNTLKGEGFTFIDLLIVSMILGILSLIVIPQFGGVISDKKLSSAANAVVSALEYTQNLAVSYQRVFYFKANITNNSFQIGDYRYKDENNPHPEEDPPVQAKGIVYHPLSKSKYDIDFDNSSEFSGVHFSTVPVGDYIYFYPDGHSSDTQTTLALVLGNESRTIIIDGATGNITVQ
jgi:Tfp pilus assembly protein FimT